MEKKNGIVYTNKNGETFNIPMSKREESLLRYAFRKVKYLDKTREYLVEEQASNKELKSILKSILDKNNGHAHLEYLLKKMTDKKPKNIKGIGYRWIEQLEEYKMFTPEDCGEGEEEHISLPFIYKVNGVNRLCFFTYLDGTSAKLRDKKYSIYDLKQYIRFTEYHLINLYCIDVENGKIEKIYQEYNPDDEFAPSIQCYAFDIETMDKLGIEYKDSEVYQCQLEKGEFEYNLIDYYNYIEDCISQGLENVESDKKEILSRIYGVECDYEGLNLLIYREVMRYLDNPKKYRNSQDRAGIIIKPATEKWIAEVRKETKNILYGVKKPKKARKLITVIE